MTKKKRERLFITDPDLKKELKLQALDQGVHLEDLATNILSQFVQHKKKKKKKDDEGFFQFPKF